MADTSDAYEEWIAYVQAYSFPDNGLTERVKCGDIKTLVQKEAFRGLGTKETDHVLLVPLSGLETTVVQALDDPVFEVDGDITQGRYEKHRYSIPFSRLQEVFPAFDAAKAKDPATAYQPFVFLGEDDRLQFDALPPFEMEGLLYDKVAGGFL